VRLHVHEAGEPAVVEDRPDEEQVVHVRAAAVGIVRDDDVAGLEPLRAVLLDRGPNGLGHHASEEEDAVAHRRRRIVQLGRTGDRRGEVVEVAQDRREGGGEEPRAHVLDDVAEPVREHGRREAIAAVALGELALAEVAQAGGRRCHAHGAIPRNTVLLGSGSITSSPKRPTAAVWPGQTSVVESASRTIAGPRSRAPGARDSRRNSPASTGPAAKWLSSTVRSGSTHAAAPAAAASYSSFSAGTTSSTR